MLEINENLKVPARELHFEFIRASGPGGQKVNRTASAVQLRFDVANSESLPPAVKSRLRRIANNRISKQGILVIEAKRHRDQEGNRKDALDRLAQLLRRAAKPPKPRHKTKPGRGAVERRLRQKRERSTKKRDRRFDPRRDQPG